MLTLGWIAQTEMESGPEFPLGIVVVWLLLVAGLTYWGHRRALEFGAPGWLGALIVGGISMVCNVFGGLFAIYLLVPFAAGAYNKGAKAVATPGQVYGPPPQSYGPPQTPPQQYVPAAAQQQPDSNGRVTCPACGAKVKVGRRSCMSCGNML